MFERVIATAVALAVSVTVLAQELKLPGRYFTPASLIEMINDPRRESMAQTYLIGTYDLTQDALRSCALRGTTSPQLLEKVFIDYIKAHPELITVDRTAAGVAAQAFAAYWPCNPN
jgi:Ssp1 endopeptidase immunity protein Rap1a